VASQVLVEVVVFSDDADFLRLDDDGVDDGVEPCFAGFDRTVG